MLITFLGTRGEIEIRSRAHRRHSATLFDAGERAVMIDCGLDWLASVSRLDVAAILLTHAHPDHAGGLRDGCACPVYATAATSQAIARFAIADLRVVEPRARFVLAGMTFEAFPVEHSLRAPAVGFRISCRSGTVFYVPDVIAVPERAAALRGVGLYIGDGATLKRPIARLRNGHRVGHASVREQLEWCASEGVPRAIFTHCGSAIVRADGRAVAAVIRELARAAGVEAAIARDGLRLELESRP